MSAEEEELSEENLSGPISWMARNSVAANLLMFIIIVAGCAGMFRTKQEVFPEFTLDVVTVSVPYPGASPAETEQGIVLAIEERVRAVDGIKRVTANAAEGAGSVSAELLLGADPDRALADIKTEVDRITTFPEEAEEPSVTLLSMRQAVITLVLALEEEGAAERPQQETLQELHQLAEKARTELLANPEITQVEIQGIPPLEVSIEVPKETLQAYGLSLVDISRQVGAQTLELPGGALKTDGGELLVRVSDRKLNKEEFANLVVRGTASGDEVLLGEIATITDGFEDADRFTRYNGKPAVRVVAYRVGNETPQSVADAVKDYLVDLKGALPENISVSIWDDDSEILRDRISLLVNNGWMGLILVFTVLALFLDLRLAFWVGLGIPISFMGAFFLLPVLDLSINMVSLFAFIITLGMVVDDAIVVGENIYAKNEEEGLPPMQAAIEGAKQMATPVTFSILTTVAAFSPLIVIPGVFGKIFRIMPLVVIAVLFFSLVESFFVLPAHLAHGSSEVTRRVPFLKTLFAPFEFVRSRVSGGLKWFIEVPYKSTLLVALEYRYMTLAIAVAVFIASIGLVAAGIVPRTFFPKLEGEVVTAEARLPYGVPVELTDRIASDLLASADDAITEVGTAEEMLGKISFVGEGAPRGGPGGGAGEPGSHLLAVQIQLVPTGEREFSAEEFAFAWEAATPTLVGLEALTFNSSVGPGAGAAVDAQLSHPDTATLAAAAEELTDILRSYPSLTNIENTYAAGKPQLDFELLPAATTLGLTANDVAFQLRSAFYGAEAVREQRGRNEIKVMVRLPERQRESEYDLEELLIRTPEGGFAPLKTIATFDRGRAATTITREDGQRVLNVRGDRAAGVKSTTEVIASLNDEVYPELKKKYPGLEISLVGEQREQSEAFGSLGYNYIIAMFAIFGLLAIPFKSYTQPLIVMSAIPFGIVGAILGHLIMGYEISFVSAMGIIALSGVVVNDSLVLIDSTNEKRREGASALESIVYGGTRRLRPILLTSLTTFFGLAPMILETSIQARFLIPMAISLGFGVLFATVIILLLVPALYMILEDVYWLWAVDPIPVSREKTPAPAK